MSADREFVDTNILVYAFDASAGAKHERARQLLERLWDEGAGCLSVQVLQEFYVTVTRKVARPLAVEDAADRVREFGAWKVFSPVLDDILAAIALQGKAHLSFRDALVIHAAGESGCSVLWTEDLQDGQRIGHVLIRSPFV